MADYALFNLYSVDVTSLTAFVNVYSDRNVNDRFTQAPNELATQRLYYLTSNLQTKGTPIENWKLEISKASQAAIVR